MNPSDSHENSDNKEEVSASALEDWGKKRLKVYSQVMSISLGSALLFGSAGYFLGKKTGNELMYAMIAVLISYPLAQYFIYKTVKPK